GEDHDGRTLHAAVLLEDEPAAVRTVNVFLDRLLHKWDATRCALGSASCHSDPGDDRSPSTAIARCSRRRGCSGRAATPEPPRAPSPRRSGSRPPACTPPSAARRDSSRRPCAATRTGTTASTPPL